MPPPSPPLGRFQFTLGHILWTMFVCSVTAAIVRALDWPTQVQIPLIGVLLAYAVYAIFRLPSVLGDLRGGSTKWRRIREHRAQLERMVDERRPKTTGEPTAAADPAEDDSP